MPSSCAYREPCTPASSRITSSLRAIADSTGFCGGLHWLRRTPPRKSLPVGERSQSSRWASHACKRSQRDPPNLRPTTRLLKLRIRASCGQCEIRLQAVVNSSRYIGVRSASGSPLITETSRVLCLKRKCDRGSRSVSPTPRGQHSVSLQPNLAFVPRSSTEFASCTGREERSKLSEVDPRLRREAPRGSLWPFQALDIKPLSECDASLDATNSTESHEREPDAADLSATSGSPSEWKSRPAST